MVTLTWISDVPTTSGEEGLYIAGILQTIGGLVVPGLAFLLLFIMAFTMKERAKKPMIWTTVLGSVLMVAFTGGALLFAPQTATVAEEVPTTLPERIVAGQDLYSVQCVECHGDDGSATTIENTEVVDDVEVTTLTEITPINSRDVLYTLTDSALIEVISYGRPNYGMNPFGKAYGGELTRNEIDNMVTFMRYAWDDRFEMPEIPELFPPLAEGEVPSYDVHIAPIAKRYCVSCHRAGKENNDFLMTSYEEILTTGENSEFDLIPGEDYEQSYLLQTIQQQPILDENGEEIIGVMPPKSVLKPDVVNVWKLWIQNGMPKTAEEAEALSTMPAETEETP
jgi:mono/diheme cytochrome c family protein